MFVKTYSRYFLRYLILLVLAAGPASLLAQGQPISRDTSGDNIIIDHFGKLIEDREGIEPVKWISQGLQLRIDSTNIYADSAVIYSEDRVFAYGNVVIQQGDSLHVFTDTLYYFRATDVANLVGEVVLEQGTRQLWTTDLTYHLGERFGEYHQGGVLVDKDLQVTSKRGLYHAGSQKVVFKDSVIVLHPKFDLAADSMTYLAGQKRVLFTGPTNIYTKSAKIYCEGGFYDLPTETAEFNKNAQYAGQQKTATADTIRYFSKLGEVIMSGHVNVTETDRTITGNTLRYFERTGETWITGEPAIYKDSTRSIVGPEIFYNEKTNQLTTKGKSEISDGEQRIKMDEFNYNELTGLSEAIGNVEWRDTVRNLGIRSERMEYSKSTGYVLAYGTGRSMFFTVVDGDTLYITADTLNMWSVMDSTMMDSMGHADTIRMIRAYHDVRLLKSNLQGLADSLVYHGRDSIFNFFGDPVLWSDTTQFSADTIYMQMKNSQVDEIILQRRALILSEILQTYYDQIKGKTIVAHFDSSAIEEMVVTGNAESIYYTRDDKSAFIGVNKTICSKMYFTFDNGEIHFLKYYGDNTSNLLPMGDANHSTLRLEGFNWRNEERPYYLNDLY